MNKYSPSLSLTVILIIIVFLYMLGVVDITSRTIFAFAFSALIFSTSSTIGIFVNNNKLKQKLRSIFDTLAICVVIIIPNLQSIKIDFIMNSNILLLLTLFFMLIERWAMEQKIQD